MTVETDSNAPFDREMICQIADELKHCSSLLLITGAGISADSGIPTYRGIGGLYEAKNTEEGVPIDQALSGPMFKSRPALTWKYLMQIADAVHGAKSNRAHEIIALFETVIDRVWTLTQNVDGFHIEAGSSNVIEIHGNMRSIKCIQCDFSLQIAGLDYDELKITSLPPLCPECDNVL